MLQIAACSRARVCGEALPSGTLSGGVGRVDCRQRAPMDGFVGSFTLQDSSTPQVPTHWLTPHTGVACERVRALLHLASHGG